MPLWEARDFSRVRLHFELSRTYNGDEKKVFAYVDGKYEVSGIRCFAEKLTSLAYVYNVPFLFICALRNEKGETDYGGTSMNPLAKGILLTDDIFMKITHLAAGYDPFGEQPADNL